ncbi:MAG: PAS domain S-box protein [Candidatus Odinarchaeota archaeon]
MPLPDLDDILDEEEIPVSVKKAIKRLIIEFGHTNSGQGSFPVKQKYHDVTALQNAFAEAQQRETEILAILTSTRAVLYYREFKDAALAIFDSCKNLIGTTAGFLAVLSEDREHLDLFFIDFGGSIFTVSSSKPVPLTDGWKEIIETGRPFYRNSPYEIDWFNKLSGYDVKLDNVLINPFIINGKTAGLLCLGNKPNDIVERDLRITANFGELAAISLNNNLMLESLENSEELFRSVVQTARDAIICINSSSGNIVFWNRGAEDIFGYSVTEALGKHIDTVIPKVSQKLHGLISERNRVTVERKGIRKDESEITVDLSVANWKTKEGSFYTIIIRDITERKKLEEMLYWHAQELDVKVEEKALQLIEKQQQMLHQERSALLGRIAGSVAHDINNPLQYVRGNAELVLDLIESGNITLQELPPLMRVMIDGCDKILETSERLRRVSRKDAVMAPFDLFNSINTAIAMTKGRWKKVCRTIRIESAIEGPVKINGIENDITHVFMNILVNAAQSIEKRGEINIRVFYDGNDVSSEIIDTGHGIKPEIMGKIGKEAITTKSVEEGTGLGLLGAYEIIIEHGGKIELESELNKGTLVRIVLPLLKDDQS